MRKFLLLFALILMLTNCSEKMDPLDTVVNVDINRYLGKWYEIARLPNRFEKGLICVTAEYGMRADGKISVLNSGRPEDNPGILESAKGKAWLPDKNQTGRLKVQFFWPFSGNYYIFHLDDDYQYALVGEPSRKFLWLLSRKSTISDELYNELMDLAATKGFDVNSVYKVPQNCE